MKQLLLAASIAMSAPGLFAQGTIVFNNHVVNSVVAWVYGAEVDPYLTQTGNDATGYPVGTTVYGGPRLSGSGYTAQLWGGPTASSLAPAAGFGTSPFRTGAAAGLWVTSTDPAVIPGVLEGQTAFLQVRVWNNEGGTVNTWGAALGAGVTGLGMSAIFTSLPLGGLSPPPNLVGLTSFNITGFTPEPSTFALLGLGSAALLAFGRRRLP